jgi:glycosyltransferase involved in cell wall biosynthesis
MKKIGIFLNSVPDCGGTFQYNQAVLEALAALPRNGFSIVATYTSDRWLSYLQSYNFKTLRLPRNPQGWAEFYAMSLLNPSVPLLRRIYPLSPRGRIMLREQCDLWIFPSQDEMSFQLPVHSLVSIHDLMHRYERRFPESASGNQYRFREYKYRNICKWAGGVLVDSELGRQQVVESYGMPAERIHVLPFIAPRYMQAATPPEGFDRRYRLPAKFIFYPAQFWEHKNHKRLIQAVASLKGEFPDLKLVLSGSEKNAYPAVVALVRELGLVDDVLFLGYVPDDDMPELNRRARALVMPTFYGPTNIPPLEAFTVGCPVAISGIYGMPEQVGEAALLFDPVSIDDIASSIRRLWTDDALCARLAAAGKERIAHWGQEQFNQKLRLILETVTQERQFTDAK